MYRIDLTVFNRKFTDTFTIIHYRETAAEAREFYERVRDGVWFYDAVITEVPPTTLAHGER